MNGSCFRMLWALRRMMGLSPTQAVFRELRRRGVRLGELHALELFAHSGFLHTKDYLGLVGSLEAWEIDPAQEAALRHHLPGAFIRITDSYQEIRQTPHKYSLVVLDAPDGMHGFRHEYCEHFMIFPEVFRAVHDSAVLLLNIMPGSSERACQERWFSAAHREQRRQFYGTDHPEQLTVDEMIAVYRSRIEQEGFVLEWHVSRPRTRDGRLHYLALKVRRQGKPLPRHGAPPRPAESAAL